MKICPTCKQQYPNGFQYCPSDTDVLLTGEEYLRRSHAVAPPAPAETGKPAVTEVISLTGQAPPEPPKPQIRETQPVTPFRRAEPPKRETATPPPTPSVVRHSAGLPATPPMSAPTGAQAKTQPNANAGKANVNVPPPAAPRAHSAAPTAGQAAALIAAPFAAPSLSFSMPESGSIITRLGAALRSYSDSFGKGGPPLKPGDMAGFNFLLKEESLTQRVGREMSSAGEDFRRNPRGFVVATLKGEGSSKQRRRWLLNGMAGSVIAYSFIFFVLPTIFILMGWNKLEPEVAKAEELVQITDLAAIPLEVKVKKVAEELKAKAGGSKPKPQAAKGGGGGGREQPTPPSKGAPPRMSLTPQIVLPNPEPPKIKNPSLVVASTTYGDPKAIPPMKGPTGDPLGVPAPPSSGPGKNAGIGTGGGSGVGGGQGGGLGPGRGGNTGGGDIDLGGGRGGIEDMGKNGVSRVTILYREKAKYTEEARQNKVQGTVVLGVVFTADGRVSNVRVVRGLPDGLTEKAIEAAQRIRFQPATKNGAPVTVRGTLEYSFNLY